MSEQMNRIKEDMKSNMMPKDTKMMKNKQIQQPVLPIITQTQILYHSLFLLQQVLEREKENQKKDILELFLSHFPKKIKICKGSSTSKKLHLKRVKLIKIFQRILLVLSKPKFL